MAVIAVDCGGTNLVYGRYDPDGRGEPAGVRPTPREAAAIPGAVVAAIAPLFGTGGRPPIGIGSAGLVDHATGTLVWSPHASGGGVALGPEVAAATGLPVVVDNDANLAALAEARLGAGAGPPDGALRRPGHRHRRGPGDRGPHRAGPGLPGGVGAHGARPLRAALRLRAPRLLGGPGLRHRPGPGRRARWPRPTRTERWPGPPPERRPAGEHLAPRRPRGDAAARARTGRGRGLAGARPGQPGGRARPRCDRGRRGGGRCRGGPARPRPVPCWREVVEGGRTIGPRRRWCRPASAPGPAWSGRPWWPGRLR